MTSEVGAVSDGHRPVLAEKSHRLIELEERVEQSFDDAGEALEAIRTEGLYLETHKTWAAYLSDRWRLSTSQAGLRIEGWRLRKHLQVAAVGLPPPSLNAAAEFRPLASVSADAVAPLYAELVAEAGGEAPTAAAVREKVNGKLGRRTDEEIVDAFASGKPGYHPPEIRLVLTVEEAARIGRCAEGWGIRAHEIARGSMFKGLPWYERNMPTPDEEES